MFPILVSSQWIEKKHMGRECSSASFHELSIGLKKLVFKSRLRNDFTKGLFLSVPKIQNYDNILDIVLH